MIMPPEHPAAAGYSAAQGAHGSPPGTQQDAQQDMQQQDAEADLGGGARHTPQIEWLRAQVGRQRERERDGESR